jgi:hypothetical protein
MRGRQVPLISGHNNARRLIRAGFWVALHRSFDDDRRNRYAGNPRDEAFDGGFKVVDDRFALEHVPL